MTNNKSVKVQVMFPAGLHARLVTHAERSGVPVNQALMNLVDRYTALSGEVETRTTKKEGTPKDLERQEKQLLKQLKPYNEKLEDATITFEERDERYDLIEQLAQVRTELGTAKRPAEETMQSHYAAEFNSLSTQHEAEEEDLFNPLATPEFHKQYKERAERINVLKDRLK